MSDVHRSVKDRHDKRRIREEETMPIACLREMAEDLKNDDIGFLVKKLEEGDTTKIKSALSICQRRTFTEEFWETPQRPPLVRALLEVEMFLNPLSAEFTPVCQQLVQDLADAAYSLALPLRGLVTLLHATEDAEKISAAVIECRGVTQDKNILKHLDDVLKLFGQHDPLGAFAVHMEADRARAKRFRHRYSGKFRNLAESHCRAVLWFGVAADPFTKFEQRQVPVRFEAALFTHRQEVDWSKLVVVNGPSGTGKTCLGLFGLATQQQLVVFVHRPPIFLSEQLKDTEDDTKQDEVRILSKEVTALLNDAQKKTDKEEAREYYMRALRVHIVDTLEKRIGKRTGVRDDETVEVIFFFDELGGRGENADVVRPAVRDLAFDWQARGEDCDLATALRQDFGLKLHGIAMSGTGLDVEVAVGSLSEASEQCHVVTPFVDAMRWDRLTHDAFQKDEQVPTHVGSELDAVLQLPRLAALVLEVAAGILPISEHFLFECVPVAAKRFAKMNCLEPLIHDAAKRQEVGLQCLRLMLFPLPVFEKVLPDDIRAIFATYGLGMLHKKENVFKITIGPAQRLLLRHFFALVQHAGTGEGFELAVADFLCLAAVASRGKTLADLLTALNEFFSHAAQHKDESFERPKLEDKVRDLQHLVIDCSSGVMKSLHNQVQPGADMQEVASETGLIAPPEDEATVFVNGDNAASWNLQLVVPVKKVGAVATVFVTFDIQTKRYLSASFSKTAFDKEAENAASTPMVVPGARRGGFIVVVGRLLGEATWIRQGVPVWHVNLTDPGSLGVIPFRVWNRKNESAGKQLSRRVVIRRTAMSPDLGNSEC